MTHILEENYHIYNRGAHKAPIFHDRSDYIRFLILLYVKNNTESFKSYNLKFGDIFLVPRQKLVDIVCYCLMPNHFHITVREKKEGGISKFIHKLCTSYSMYYNNKYKHSGTVFQGPYGERHIDSDEYFRYLIQYIHLNPFGIEEPDLNRIAKTEYYDEAVAYSKDYEFSSFKDYLGENRSQRTILGFPGEA